MKSHSRYAFIVVFALVLDGMSRTFAQAPKLEIQRAIYEAVDGTGAADVTEKLKAMIVDGHLSVTASNKALGGDPTPMHVKRLRVEYTLDGKPQVVIVKENEQLELPPPAPLTPEQRKQKSIAALKSDASFKEKCDACRELTVLGGKEAIPLLAGLLADEKLSHMARYALEPNPDPAVDEALRDALGRLKGRALVGVIHSVGIRRDTKAVALLAKFLRDSDADVAQTAARALGGIGNSASAKALTDALPSTPAANQDALYEGLLRCAEALAAEGNRAEALAIYDRLRGLQQIAHQVRTAALRGAVLLRGAEGIPLLQEGIRDNDFVVVEAAARTALEMQGPEVTQILADELGKVSPDKQILLAQTLGKRADPVAVPALVALAKSGEKSARMAAIRALPEIGSPTATQCLIELLEDPVKEIAQAAQESLAALPGTEVDAEITALLNKPQTKIRCTGIELFGRRRMTGAIPLLMKLTDDPDQEVRIASFKILGDLQGPEGLPIILGIFMKTKTPQEMQAAEGALVAFCARQTDPDTCADKIITTLAQAQGTHKLALLRVLRSVGGAKALAAVRTAAADADADVRNTALRVLCEWPTVDALPDVSKLMKTTTDAKLKILALRGYIRLVPLQDTSADKKLASLKEALPLVERNEEKKLVLAALGGIPLAESLSLVTPHLATQELHEEASAAAVAIAEKILQAHPSQVAEAMEKVSTTNAKLSKRAKALLEQAKRAASKR